MFIKLIGNHLISYPIFGFLNHLVLKLLPNVIRLFFSCLLLAFIGIFVIILLALLCLGILFILIFIPIYVCASHSWNLQNVSDLRSVSNYHG
jgi:hypothetical protein